jgi:DNA-binding phage protein
MRTWPLVALIVLLGLSSAPAFADNVYLTNGRSFEGVIAVVSDAKVSIRMQGGTLSLPRAQVLRIESADSSLATYLKKKDDLQRSEEPSAKGWLDLALWARSKGMSQAAREAAMTAAQLDPTLPGLEPMMRTQGYVFEAALGRWIPYSESMHRRGLVLSDGAWVQRAEFEAAERAREEIRERERARRAEAAREAREERLAQLAELSLAREVSAQTQATDYPYYPQAVVIVPGFILPPVRIPMHHRDDGSHHPTPQPQRRDEDDSANRSTFTRVPGSLIPGHFPSSSPQHP